MTNVVYSVVSGKLVIKDKVTQSFLRESDFDGVKVHKILPLDNQEGCVVLLDPGGSKESTFENLLLVSPLGEILWKAQLPRTNDAFVAILRNGSTIEGRTWTGIRVQVDAATGRTVEIGFSK